MGFINEPYIGYEGDEFVTVTVQAIGDLANSIAVQLTSEPSGDPNEATGKLPLLTSSIMCCLICPVCMFIHTVQLFKNIS